MYPCSNPELVGAVAKAGGIGIVQPLSLTFVHGYGFRDGPRLAKRLANGKPIGMNALFESCGRKPIQSSTFPEIDKLLSRWKAAGRADYRAYRRHVQGVFIVVKRSRMHCEDNA